MIQFFVNFIDSALQHLRKTLYYRFYEKEISALVQEILADTSIVKSGNNFNPLMPGDNKKVIHT